MLALLGSGLAAPSFATDKALLDMLLENGTITPIQADEIRKKSAVVVTPNRPTTNQLKVRGRIQGQWAMSDGSNSGTTATDDYSTFEARRIRVGVQGKFADVWDYQLEINAVSSANIDTAFVAYNLNKNGKIIFGKNKPQFGLEENTSSADILTIERSTLTNYFQGGKPVGLRYEGKADIFSYYVGIFNGQNESTDRQGSNGDSYLFNASGVINLDDKVGEDVRLKLRLDFLKDNAPSGYYRFNDAIAVSAQVGVGEFDVSAEYMKGEDANGRDIDGFYIMPSFYIVPKKWQAVLRYEVIDGDVGANVGTHRYADRVPGLNRIGNEYDSVYLGVNYYIKGNNLKLMFGVDQGTNKNSVSNVKGKATTFASAVRMQF